MSYMNWGEFKEKVAAAAGVRGEDDIDITSIDVVTDDLLSIWVNGNGVELPY